MKKLLLILGLALSLPLLAQTKVLALSGSNRKNSYNKSLMNEAVAMARQMGMSVAVANLEDYSIPFYNADLEKSEGMPEAVKRFRKLMIESDVILIVSPEYNSSIPGQLKNMLDWASRSEDAKFSRAAFKNKRFALMSASPGKKGGARGLVHLREIIQDIGGEVIPLQVSVAETYKAFDEKGHLKDEALREKIHEELASITNAVAH